MPLTLAGKTVLITGGTGTFGSAFLDKCLMQNAKEIRIFSRDEKKQYDMAHRYRDHGNVKFYIGDVRDRSTIESPMNGVDFVFHAAAMKQVPTCEDFPMEAVKTNVLGSENVLNTAIEHGIRKVVVLSTDKAVYPTSAMGMTKAYMEKLALQKAAEQDATDIVVTRFGNLVASRGSAVPVFLEQAQNGLPITITDPDMTRFMMKVQDAVDLVAYAFSLGRNGSLMIKAARACKTGDLAKAVCRYMNLSKDYPVEIIGKRPGEKMHESLLTEEEAERALWLGDYASVWEKKSLQSDPSQLFAYESDKADQMTEDQILRMIEEIFREKV